FGKVYAINHVRADRWYKLGRTILYGRLEDEAPFRSVRRLVEHEDYMLRLFQDLGIASAAPLGIVELTPEREYMLLTEFFADAADEIAEAFASARGIAIPTQLRTMIKDSGRDLVAEFRRLGPTRRPIGLQHWNVGRLALLLAAAVFVSSLAAGVKTTLTPREAS